MVVWVLVELGLLFGFALFREQAAAKASASHRCLQKGRCFIGASGSRSDLWLRFFVGYFKTARTPDIRSLDCDLGPAKLPTGFRVDPSPRTTRERGQVGNARKCPIAVRFPDPSRQQRLFPPTAKTAAVADRRSGHRDT